MGEQDPDCGTVVGASHCDPRLDAEALHNAMKGIVHHDSKAIIEIATSRSNKQRLAIASAYQLQYGKELAPALKTALVGSFQEVTYALFLPPEVYDAQQIHEAIAGLGTSEGTLIEIICTRTNAELNDIASAYRQLYGKDLSDDISNDTSGSFKKLLIEILSQKRDERMEVNLEHARADAQALLEAGPQRWGADRLTFVTIFTTRSFPQLKIVFREFELLARKSIEKAIASEITLLGDIGNALIAIGKISKNKHHYFAELLHKSMKGLGTNDKALTRLIVSRSEIDLKNIRTSFQSLYNQPLESWISETKPRKHKCRIYTQGLWFKTAAVYAQPWGKGDISTIVRQGDTSGDYKRILLMLCGYKIA